MSSSQSQKTDAQSDETAAADDVPGIAVIGNPNCGKSTLFNALTGLRHKVGNYPGVTVEKKTGRMFSPHGKPVELIDLPGTYSLSPRSPDEKIGRDVLLGDLGVTERPQGVVCVIDASNLERNLYLLTQLLELELPVIVALNMLDLAEGAGLRIDCKKLESRFGIPFVPCKAISREGITEMRQAIGAMAFGTREHPKNPGWSFAPEIENAISELQSVIEGEGILPARPHALLLLGDHRYREDEHALVPATIQEAAQKLADQLAAAGIQSSESMIDSRYGFIHEVCEEAVTRSEKDPGPSMTERLDAVLIHPWLGWGCFASLMIVMFWSIFSFADNYGMGPVEELFAWIGDTVGSWIPEGDLQSLIVDGIIAGVGGVVVFLPQILVLFFFIGLLESTGYMARAAFLMDRLMSKVGLNGKSFVPLLSSYACAIPGIMAARTIENPRDRLITILVAPFMSCSARLPVYVLMIVTIFPSENVSTWTKTGIMFGLYALGTVTAFLFAWIFKKTLGKGEKSMFLMELPPYRPPKLSSVLRQLWERAMVFLKRAGTIILGISIILWALETYPKSDSDDPAVQTEESFLGQGGKLIEPIVEPLGYDWKIGVGVIASFAAREVFNSTMAVIYSVEDEEDHLLIREKFRQAKRSDGTPVFTPLVCISLLVFYVFALQCGATLAVVKRETNSWKWPIFQFAYMSAFAYLAALVVFQVGTALGY